MNASLVWEIVGSTAGVIATVFAFLQFRQGRRRAGPLSASNWETAHPEPKKIRLNGLNKGMSDPSDTRTRVNCRGPQTMLIGYLSYRISRVETRALPGAMPCSTCFENNCAVATGPPCTSCAGWVGSAKHNSRSNTHIGLHLITTLFGG